MFLHNHKLFPKLITQWFTWRWQEWWWQWRLSGHNCTDDNNNDAHGIITVWSWWRRMWSPTTSSCCSVTCTAARSSLLIIIIIIVIVAIFIGVIYCDFAIIVIAFLWLSWVKLTDRSACWEVSSKPSWSWSSSSCWPRLTWKSMNWEASSRRPPAFRSKDSQTIKAGRWGIIDWEWLMTDDQQQVGKSPEKRARPPSSQTQAGPIRLLSQNEGKLPSMLKSP